MGVHRNMIENSLHKRRNKKYMYTCIFKTTNKLKIEIKLSILYQWVYTEMKIEKHLRKIENEKKTKEVNVFINYTMSIGVKKRWLKNLRRKILKKKKKLKKTMQITILNFLFEWGYAAMMKKFKKKQRNWN